MRVLWLDQAQGDVPPGNEWLSAGERRTLAGLHVPKRRDDWRLGRWTAKCAIAAVLSNAAEFPEIEILARDCGAPAAFVRGRPAGLTISLSHSGGRGFCALTAEGAAIGCDVESIEARSAEFLSDYFTDLEQALVAASAAPVRIEMANLLWSAKESALKALGVGLRANPQSVAVFAADEPGSSGEWRELAASYRGERVFHGWWRSLGGFVWTVLSEPSPSALTALNRVTAAKAE